MRLFRSALTIRTLTLALLVALVLVRTGVACGPGAAMAAEPAHAIAMGSMVDCHEAPSADHSNTGKAKGAPAAVCVTACSAVSNAPVAVIDATGPTSIPHNFGTAIVLLGRHMGPAPPPPRAARS